MWQGCVAESPLFRDKRDWFRFIFPLFQKYVTKQFVPVSEAGRRVALVVSEVLPRIPTRRTACVRTCLVPVRDPRTCAVVGTA